MMPRRQRRILKKLALVIALMCVYVSLSGCLLMEILGGVTEMVGGCKKKDKAPPPQVGGVPPPSVPAPPLPPPGQDGLAAGGVPVPADLGQNAGGIGNAGGGDIFIPQPSVGASPVGVAPDSPIIAEVIAAYKDAQGREIVVYKRPDGKRVWQAKGEAIREDDPPPPAGLEPTQPTTATASPSPSPSPMASPR